MSVSSYGPCSTNTYGSAVLRSHDIDLYRIALTMLPRVGPATARTLLRHLGSPRAVVEAQAEALRQVPNVGPCLIGAFEALDRDQLLQKAEREYQFILEKHITPLYFEEPDYPSALAQCPDSPTLLYYSSQKPFAELEALKAISIVGTRNASKYGWDLIHELLRDLQAHGHRVLVVSGLASGIDGAAHQAALSVGYPTVAVLGHGLRTIYPAEHKDLAKEIWAHGGLLTEYPSYRAAERGQFLQRNRIIAGLSVATIVVESSMRGGALVTAHHAKAYGRVVMAFPGPVHREYSAGCNALIKREGGMLIESAEDLERALNWESPIPAKSRAHSPDAQPLFYQPTPEESEVVRFIKEREPTTFDEIIRALRLSPNELNAMLLKLEFHGVVVSLPGRHYKLR